MIALDEKTRSLARAVIDQPRFIERGRYSLPVKGGEAIEVDLRTALLFRQIERVLLRLVESNRSAIVALAGSDVESDLITFAWHVVDRIRAMSFVNGEPETMFADQIIVGFLNGWDTKILELFDEVLLRVIDANPAIFGREEAA